MIWQRGSEILEVGHIGHTIRSGVSAWLVPVIGGFVFVVVVAVVVLLFVTSADFHPEQTQVPVTPGSCAPFCTATGVPPPPGPP
jgi:hypothetical protein